MRLGMLRLLIFGLTSIWLGATAVGEEKKPRLPAGRDPGGTAVAFLSTGIDYTHPAIARRLARDGEGELIGWDLVDNDNRPYGKSDGRTGVNAGHDSTALVSFLLGGEVPVRLVPVRINPDDPVSRARAVAFVARTPALIVLVPKSHGGRSDWEPFGQAVQHFSHLLFIVPAGDEGRDLDEHPVYPAGLGLPNMLVVTAANEGGVRASANRGRKTVDALAVADNSVWASVVAAQAAAALLSREPKLLGAALKRRLIEIARSLGCQAFFRPQ
jgi:hypothetical protein